MVHSASRSRAKGLAGDLEGTEEGANKSRPGLTSICSRRLVANKIDLAERVRVHTTQATEFARRNGLDYFQVSALTNSNGTPLLNARPHPRTPRNRRIPRNRHKLYRHTVVCVSVSTDLPGPLETVKLVRNSMPLPCSECTPHINVCSYKACNPVRRARGVL